MKRHKLDSLCLQEAHINTNTKETHDDCCSAKSVTDKQREDAVKIREDEASSTDNGQGKGECKAKQQTVLEWYNLEVERLRTAIVYHNIRCC